MGICVNCYFIIGIYLRLLNMKYLYRKGNDFEVRVQLFLLK